MHKSRESIDQQQAAQMSYGRLTGMRFFSFNCRKQKKPDKLREVKTAVEKFKVELFRTLRIPQIAEWLSRRLK